MYKLIKIGLALIIVGFIVSIGFGIVSGASFNSYFGDEDFTYVEKTYAADDFSGFDFDLSNKAITILPSESGNIDINYYDSDLNWIEVDETGNELSLQSDSEWYAHLALNFSIINLSKYMQFYLYIPVSEYYDLTIASPNGSISLENYLNAGELNFDTSNGAIHLTNVESDQLIDLRTSNGRITLTNVETTDEILGDTVNGRIVFDGVKALAVNVNTSNGTINGSGIDTSDFDAHTSNGNIELTFVGNFADYHLRMSTSNGSYYLNNDKVTTNNYNTDKNDEIQLDTSNGNVEVNFSS